MKINKLGIPGVGLGRQWLNQLLELELEMNFLESSGIITNIMLLLFSI